MKNLLAILLVALLGTSANAQQPDDISVKIGWHIIDIKEYIVEFDEVIKEERHFIVQSVEHRLVFYYFNEEQYCDVQVYRYHISYLGWLKSMFEREDLFMKVADSEYMVCIDNFYRSFIINVNERTQTVIILVEDIF